MSNSTGNGARRYPLHVTIAFAFTGLLLLIGGVLIAFNYFESRKLALVAADDLFERTSAHVRTSIAELYVPVHNFIDVSSRALPADAPTLDLRLESLIFLAEPLRLNPHMSSVFVGYENGDFFLVRAVQGEVIADQALQSPPAAVFAVQSTDYQADGSRIDELLFYDAALELLERRAVESTDFDPRQRDWYRQAIDSDSLIATDFYVFFTTRQVGLTVARKLAHGGAVVGADVALSEIEAGLEALRSTPSTKIAVLGAGGGVVALSDRVEVPIATDDSNARVEMPKAMELDDPIYRHLGEQFGTGLRSGRHDFSILGEIWLTGISRLPTRSGKEIYLAVMTPRDELLAEAKRVRNTSVLISLGLLILAILPVATVARHISKSLRALSLEAEEVREFRLDTPITVGSRIREVDDLADTMAMMKASIQQFLTISQALSAEKDYRRVLDMVLTEAAKVSRSDGGAILLRTEDEQGLRVAFLANSLTGARFDGTSADAEELGVVDLAAGGESDGRQSLDRQTALQAELIQVDDLQEDSRYDLRGVRERFDKLGYETASILSVPLCNQLEEVIGVLQLVKSRGAEGVAEGFRPEIVSYIEALSSDAAVALDIRRLLKAQKDLLESFTHVVAGAIDAKSPYTHGHCQRVPIVARMLAEAADATSSGPFAEFRLTDDEWYELHLASWLHDCGKVTTPEYVVDKATKLETIYNRIHEIRMRFEVLWRDAQIEYYQALAQREADEEVLRKRLDKRLEQICDDFEFVASCNLGDEFMSDERLERVQKIAGQSWTRHLDDRLGLSHGELKLRQEVATAGPPVEEQLLADKPEHIITREESGDPYGDNRSGFRMEVPENLYNRGELHNLAIQRGTLTAEERFKINEHVIQTIRMLERLPFPKELRRVPDWAGNHHEKMDGTGYPRKLLAAELSIPERIMAVADIFEALTAADRPYHAAKNLSQVLRIMRSMCDSGHLCPELFELFLTSGIYLEYAREYMQPSQIDRVEVESVLTS